MTLRNMTVIDRMKRNQEKIEAVELDWKGREKKRTARGQRRREEREAKREREIETKKHRMDQFKKYLEYREELDFE